MNSKCSIPEESNHKGFTLLELIVVLAGLGILSGLAIPNYMKYLDYARVDEAKSLLNSAAADCLQGLRRKGNERLSESVDENILSNNRLESAGYTFSDIESTSSCGNTLITAISPDDQERMPTLGFTISTDGKLTKLAVNTGEETSFATKAWAGKNVTDSVELIKLMDYKQSITKARTECIQKFNTWLENVGDNGTTTWNDTADSGCPSKPPLVISETCTTRGCTRPIYALDNKVVGNTQEAYDAAFKAKYDELCSQEVIAKRTDNAMTPDGEVEEGELVNNCGQKRFWFFEGESVGTKDAWKALACENNKQKLLGTTHSGAVAHCAISPIYIIGGEEIFPTGSREDAKAEFEKRLAENKDAQCTQALNNDATGKKGGPFTSPTPSDMSAPIGRDCNIKYWYCKDKIYREERQYNEDERCQNKAKDCLSLRPKPVCDWEQFFRIPPCKEYNECMGRI